MLKIDPNNPNTISTHAKALVLNHDINKAIDLKILANYKVIGLGLTKNDLGLHGIEIGSNVNDHNLNEEQFHDIFEACEDLSLSLFIHPWQMM